MFLTTNLGNTNKLIHFRHLSTKLNQVSNCTPLNTCLTNRIVVASQQTHSFRVKSTSVCLLRKSDNIRQNHQSSITRHANHQIKCDQPLRGMAGHSKWANIKHIKGAKDAQKSKISAQIVQQMKVAIMEGGNADPKLNIRLANVMERGAAANIPKSTMEQTLKKYKSTKNNGQKIFIEMLGPANIQLIVEAITEKPGYARQELVATSKKFGGKLGNAFHSFELKGIVHAAIKEGNVIDEDTAMEIAIEADAEDVEIVTDGADDERAMLRFICDQENINVVKNNMEGLGYEVLAARTEYLPKHLVTVTEAQLQIVEKCITAIQELETTIRIYDNIQVQET